MRVCARALCSAGTGPGRKCTRPRKVAGVPDLGLSVAVSSYISVPVQMSLLCNSEMSRGGSRHVNPKGGRGREAQVRALPTARRSRRGPSVPPHAAEAFRPVPRARCPRGRGCVHTRRLSLTPLLEAHPGTWTILPKWHQVHSQGPGRPLPLPKEHPGVCGHGNQEAVWRGGEKMGLAALVACGPPLR